MVVAADIGIKKNAGSVWLALEVLAKNSAPQDFHEIFFYGTGLTEEEQSAAYLFNGPACTSFPFECALARPHFMVENPGEGDGIGMWRRVSESPRKLLFDVQALLESRLHDPARTASLGATVKALSGWKLALDVSRWSRAVAEDIAAKRDNVFEEDDYYFRFGGVKESVCFPFEYDGPAFAGRCECCCPPSLRSPVFRKIPITPKPNDVHAAAWYRDY